METRNFQSGAVSTPPSPPAIPSNGYLTNGNPGSGVNATIPGAFWFHKIGEELRAVITSASLVPSDSNLTQLFTAIQSIAATLVNAAMPSGTIITYSGNSVPTGYLACPTAAGATGQLVSRTTYAALFAALGTTWGAGDGSTTFGIPYFPTGYAAIAGTVGSVSAGQVKAHTHDYDTRTDELVQSGGSTTCWHGVKSAQTSNQQPVGASANFAAGTNIWFLVKT